MADRYFITSETPFTFSTVAGAQATSVTAYIYIGAALEAILGLGSGITEVEAPAGFFTYGFTDKEISSNGTITVNWFAQDAGSTNADTYPVVTNPTVDVQASTPLAVLATVPTDGATDISTRNAISVQFDTSIDSTNLAPSQVSMRIVGTTNEISIAVFADTTASDTLIIAPQVQLHETTTYEIVIDTTAVYGSGGERLDSDYTFRFRTGADDFTSVTEATTEGVIDRAAPIVLAPGSTLSATTTTVVTDPFTGSDPVDGGYNITTTQFTLNYDDTLNTGVVPTVTLEFESILGLNEYYWINNQFWNQSTAPTLPMVSMVTVMANSIVIDLDAAIPGNGIMTMTVSGAETAAGDTVPDRTFTYTGSLSPYRVGVPEIRRLVRLYVSSDITDRLIAEMIANVGIDLYAIYGDEAPWLQRCVISSEVALQLYNDWLAANGGGLAVSKTLGAFSYSNRPATGKGTPVEQLLNKLDGCQAKLDAYFTTATSAVKSINHPDERKDYRIRTWRESHPYDISLDENSRDDRILKLPNEFEDWS